MDTTSAYDASASTQQTRIEVIIGLISPLWEVGPSPCRPYPKRDVTVSALGLSKPRAAAAGTTYSWVECAPQSYSTSPAVLGRGWALPSHPWSTILMQRQPTVAGSDG